MLRDYKLLQYANTVDTNKSAKVHKKKEMFSMTKQMERNRLPYKEWMLDGQWKRTDIHGTDQEIKSFHCDWNKENIDIVL